MVRFVTRFELERRVIVRGSLMVLGETDGFLIQIDHHIHGISRSTGWHIFSLLAVGVDLESFLCGHGVVQGVMSDKELGLWVESGIDADDTGTVGNRVQL